MNIYVIGCGRWGSFIAWYLDRVGHSVTLYGREGSDHLESFIKTRSNEYLTLPESILLSSDLAVCKQAEVVVISICSQDLASLIDELRQLEVENKTFVFCMKGIEAKTGRRLTEIAAQGLHPSNKSAVWIGPGHVQEFVAGMPNCMVIDSEDPSVKIALAESFSGGQIRFYYGMDIIGSEIGAASKNVIGIAAGILDGLNIASLKGALMSRGTKEIADLITVMGGNPLSAYGLCHLGDYEATVFSPLSNNRRFGECIITGEDYTKLAEGYYTAQALMVLAEKHTIELPICGAVYRILYEKSDPRHEFEELFSRKIKNEF